MFQYVRISLDQIVSLLIRKIINKPLIKKELHQI